MTVEIIQLSTFTSAEKVLLFPSSFLLLVTIKKKQTKNRLFAVLRFFVNFLSEKSFVFFVCPVHHSIFLISDTKEFLLLLIKY